MCIFCCWNQNIWGGGWPTFFHVNRILPLILNCLLSADLSRHSGRQRSVAGKLHDHVELCAVTRQWLEFLLKSLQVLVESLQSSSHVEICVLIRRLVDLNEYVTHITTNKVMHYASTARFV